MPLMYTCLTPTVQGQSMFNLYENSIDMEEITEVINSCERYMTGVQRKISTMITLMKPAEFCLFREPDGTPKKNDNRVKKEQNQFQNIEQDKQIQKTKDKSSKKKKKKVLKKRKFVNIAEM